MARLLAGLLLIVAAGCGRAEVFPQPSGTGGGAPAGAGGGDPGPIALSLNDNGGCGDAFFYALNTEATVMVTVYWPNRIHSNPALSELTLPTTAVLADPPEIKLLRGNQLRELACNDVISPGTWEKHGALISGKLSVEIGIGKESGAFGTLHLDDAIFADPDGGEVKVMPLQVGPVHIGWLPG